MECRLHRVPMRDPGDASAILRLIDEGLISPHEIVAVFGKTEGNGCVNDFTRGYATMAISSALATYLEIPTDEVASRIAIMMSGGTEGGLSPHFLVFAVREYGGVPGGAPDPRPARRRVHRGGDPAQRLLPAASDLIQRAPHGGHRDDQPEPFVLVTYHPEVA